MYFFKDPPLLTRSCVVRTNLSSPEEFVGDMIQVYTGMGLKFVIKNKTNVVERSTLMEAAEQTIRANTASTYIDAHIETKRREKISKARLYETQKDKPSQERKALSKAQKIANYRAKKKGLTVEESKKKKTEDGLARKEAKKKRNKEAIAKKRAEEKAAETKTNQ